VKVLDIEDNRANIVSPESTAECRARVDPLHDGLMANIRRRAATVRSGRAMDAFSAMWKNRRRHQLRGKRANMPTTPDDPFARFKAAQREAWAVFAPVEIFTARPAAKLVKFAEVAAGQRVLDVACGTGVVALTAARLGARTSGLDLSPALLDRARQNASIAAVDVDFVEGDAEALPYPDASFDTVLSQFGHIFAPRPEAAAKEMLRVLKSGGRLAFSAWPPELFTGRQFELIARYMPPPPEGAARPAAPMLWGDPTVIRERLGGLVTGLLFERDTMIVQSLSVPHSRLAQEATIGPLTKIVEMLQGEPEKLAQLRAEYEAMLGEVFDENALHLHFIMARGNKPV
jgi:SAM-dependent methyltransferase